MVIPCFHGAELTAACIDRLRAQQGSHALDFVLVDNAADAATAALAAADVQVLPQPHNLGFAGACNVGLRRAEAPFVLVLNNDTQAAPHLLSRLHAALLADDRIAFAAPISNHVKGPACVPCGDLGRTEAGRAAIEQQLCDAHLGMVADVDSLSGLCLLGRKETWARLQGFDERFVPGNFEDDDLCLRARLLGYRLVIARDAFLHHDGHRTFTAMGLDIAAEVRRQHAVFANKWRQDAAGRAVLCELAGDHAGAAAAARLAVIAYPDWPDADWYLGRHFAATGCDREAVPHLLALLRRCPFHGDGVIRLGASWLRLGDGERAQRLWRWALSACAFNDAQGSDLLARLGEHSYRSGDLERAAADFEAAVALRPDDGVLLNRLGATLVELRRFEAAIPVLERAAAVGMALAHTNLGICHFQRGDAALSLQHFAAASAQLPDDATSQQNYARARAAMPQPAASSAMTDSIGRDGAQPSS